MLCSKISFLERRVQQELFPIVEEFCNKTPLDCHRRVIWALEIIQIEKIVPKQTPFMKGRPAKNPQAVARALLAKHVLNLPSVDHLRQRLQCDKHLRYICGWQAGERVPSEATFSRMFSWLSQDGLLDDLHGELVSKALEGHSVIHCGRDSCPIEVREREKKKDPNLTTERRSFRSKAGKKLTTCEYQATEASTLNEMLAPLRSDCDIGKKTNSHGISKCWRGYKLHMDVAERCFPLSCVLTAASTHDSQAAIPLSQKSSSRARVFYELMDSAYDVNAIKDFVSSQNRVPIVKIHKRRGKRKEEAEANELAYKKLNWRPAQERRGQYRFAIERLFARLHDSFLCRAIYYRGPPKVAAHVLLGVLCLCASELPNLYG